MARTDVAVATISWARSRREARRLRCALAQLSALHLPVSIADAGSDQEFGEALRSLPRFDVIVPHETRPKVITALETLLTKREPGPRRKHGNIPL